MELTDFLKELRTVLDDVVEQPTDLVPPYLRPDMQAAWPDARRSLDRLIEGVATPSPEDEIRLQEHGLRGPAFQFKVGSFQRYLRLFRRNRKPRWLKKLLGWADIILGSLVSIIPGADALKEFKEAIEQAADDEDDGSSDAAEAEVPD